MAAVAEVTRIFNRDSIKIFGHNLDITVESDREQQKENDKLRGDLDTLAKELEAIKQKQQAAERSGYLSQLTSFWYSANVD